MTTTSKIIECGKAHIAINNDLANSKIYYITGDTAEVTRKLTSWCAGRDCLIAALVDNNTENQKMGFNVILGIELGKVATVTLF